MAKDDYPAFMAQVRLKADNMTKRSEALAALPPRVLIKLYRACRDSKADMDKEAAERVRPLKTLMGMTEAFILQRLDKDQASSFTTEDGTASKKTNRYVKMSDWDAFLSWATENDLLNMLKKDVTKTDILAYMDAHPDEPLPPGISITQEECLNVRKPK